jgi:hypothetical protein
MNSISTKLGLWSALTLMSTFIIWIVCFAGIAATSPLFFWTDMKAYLEYFSSNNQFFQNLAKFAMLLFGPVYVIMVNSFHEHTKVERKTWSRLGLMFGLVFAALSCTHYFIQLSSVRLNIEKGLTSGMEHFVQANPLSVMTSVDMLGWTFFLGLSSLFTGLSISGDNRLEKWIKYAFLFNSLSCYLAMTGYMLQIDILTFLFINLGVGGAIMIISVLAAKYFSGIKNRNI